MLSFLEIIIPSSLPDCPPESLFTRGTPNAVLWKQRFQSAEATIISLCLSEALNWICSLNSLCNFFSHIAAFCLCHCILPLKNMTSFYSFFPLAFSPSCLSFSFIYFSLVLHAFHLPAAFSMTSYTSHYWGVWFQHTWQGCRRNCLVYHLKETPVVNRWHIMIAIVLEGSLYFLPWFEAGRQLRRQNDFPCYVESYNFHSPPRDLHFPARSSLFHFEI